MKFIIAIAAVLACTAAQQARAPISSSQARSADIQIVRYETENNGDGTYSYSYETSDGTSAAQKGYVKPPPQGSDESIQVAEGFFQYTSPEGEQFKLDYLADENGYQPRGEHLPTSPPIPEAIARALEIIYKNAGQQLQNERNAAPSSFSSNQQQQQRPRQSFQSQSQPQSGFGTLQRSSDFSRQQQQQQQQQQRFANF